MQQKKHHIVIDERCDNNLRVIDHDEFKINEPTIIEVFSGSKIECIQWSSHYTVHNAYPIVAYEELC